MINRGSVNDGKDVVGFSLKQRRTLIKGEVTHYGFSKVLQTRFKRTVLFEGRTTSHLIVCRSSGLSIRIF